MLNSLLENFAQYTHSVYIIVIWKFIKNANQIIPKEAIIVK